MSQKRITHQIKRYENRRRMVLKAARRLGPVDAVLISNPVDVRYLSGLVEGSKNLVIGRQWATLYTHRMYRDRPPVECPGLHFEMPDDDLLGEMAGELRKRNVRRLGVQENAMTLQTYRELRAKTRGIKLTPLTEFVSNARAVKDEEEIKLTNKAVRIAEKAFRNLIAGGASALIGKTERQVATELEVRMRDLGALGQAFPGGIIVGAGPNSAALHHVPTSRKIKEGDVVLIDWGAEVEGGYRSDQTRTLFMRRVPSRLEPIYPIVREAYQRSVDATRTGRIGQAVDHAARTYITQEGYGHEFRHGLGHGIGLDVHEPPILSQYKQRLKENMLITIEPGIYFIGYGGIRLENMLHVVNGGAKVMNNLPLSLKHAILT